MATPQPTNAQAQPTKPQSIWDNDLPAGDCPPLPRWPLNTAIVLYAIWMIFLFSMLIVRLTY